MASFDEHIKQVKSNLQFLELTSTNHPDTFWDWKVTICFYTVVHLANAHISKKMNHHYRSHEEVNNVLNPYNKVSVCSIPEQFYKAYIKLSNLSRRSRYLVSDDMSIREEKGFFTSEKHFAKAIRNLDILLDFFGQEYKIELTKYKIICNRCKDENFKKLEVIIA